MKLKKKVKRYCKSCKKHAEHTISLAKKRDRGTLKHGSIARSKKRGLGRGYGNKGRWGSKPTKPKMAGKKVSKRQDLRYKCSACNKIAVQTSSFRVKKLLFE